MCFSGLDGFSHVFVVLNEPLQLVGRKVCTDRQPSHRPEVILQAVLK